MKIRFIARMLYCIVCNVQYLVVIFSSTNQALANGTGVLWGNYHEKQFDEICVDGYRWDNCQYKHTWNVSVLMANGMRWI